MSDIQISNTTNLANLKLSDFKQPQSTKSHKWINTIMDIEQSIAAHAMHKENGFGR